MGGGPDAFPTRDTTRAATVEGDRVEDVTTAFHDEKNG
jgi:hypothetical protein